MSCLVYNFVYDSALESIDCFFARFPLLSSSVSQILIIQVQRVFYALKKIPATYLFVITQLVSP